MTQSWETWAGEGVMGWTPRRRNWDLEGKIAMMMTALGLMRGVLG